MTWLPAGPSLLSTSSQGMALSGCCPESLLAPNRGFDVVKQTIEADLRLEGLAAVRYSEFIARKDSVHESHNIQRVCVF
jgi:hypothetical protein